MYKDYEYKMKNILSIPERIQNSEDKPIADRDPSFKASYLYSSFLNVFRPFNVILSDVHNTLYQPSKYAESFNFSWDIITFFADISYNYFGNLMVYFYDMLVYPIVSLTLYVFYHNFIELFVRLISGSFMSDSFWKLPLVKGQSWFGAIVNCLSWVLFLPFELAGYVSDIVFGALFVLISPVTIGLSMFLNSIIDFPNHNELVPDLKDLSYDLVPPVPPATPISEPIKSKKLNGDSPQADMHVYKNVKKLNQDLNTIFKEDVYYAVNNEVKITETFDSKIDKNYLDTLKKDIKNLKSEQNQKYSKLLKDIQNVEDEAGLKLVLTNFTSNITLQSLDLSNHDSPQGLPLEPEAPGNKPNQPRSRASSFSSDKTFDSVIPQESLDDIEAKGSDPGAENPQSISLIDPDGEAIHGTPKVLIEDSQPVDAVDAVNAESTDDGQLKPRLLFERAEWKDVKSDDNQDKKLKDVESDADTEASTDDELTKKPKNPMRNNP
ncbi:MAG: hypothetical protein VX835_01320 [Pseudomonadota bacterium]|nr:hypothetical protein [Pseudomonadota bacterium]